MADRLTIALVNAAHAAMAQDDADSAHSLLLLAILNSVNKDVAVTDAIKEITR